MNNILIFSDLHLTQNSIVECKKIINEILDLCNKNQIDTVIDLGDTFDSTKPTSQELDLFASFIKNLNKKLIIIAAQSHESETLENSILNHFGILDDTITIIKEYHDEPYFYCGHFSLKESKKNFGAIKSKTDLKYKYVFLGHQHSFQIIKPQVCHLGSCRWINFDETSDKEKKIAIITDYKMGTEKVHFISLKSPIPMVQLELSKNEQNQAIANDLPAENVAKTSQNQANSRQNKALSDLLIKLDLLPAKTKVKIKILDFESFRRFLPYTNKYSSKFEVFKYETDFITIPDNIQKCRFTEMTTFKESFTNWLKNQKIDPKIMEILQKEIE